MHIHSHDISHYRIPAPALYFLEFWETASRTQWEEHALNIFFFLMGLKDSLREAVPLNGELDLLDFIIKILQTAPALPSPVVPEVPSQVDPSSLVPSPVVLVIPSLVDRKSKFPSPVVPEICAASYHYHNLMYLGLTHVDSPSRGNCVCYSSSRGGCIHV